ncbi:hypothetical protein D2V93_02890 [Flagellimonas taeanensis]|uniref:DNA methyltransferase n=1 Tax=Flavobacteriaceae TaxID=49546 RepID=UPI000E68FCDA|nr:MULTISPECIES: DNA methyltransferase [Allomuricauda]MDC6385379.1 DNA adenine methylase [Muricauda sp. SK9]RIV53101.1 hypothetical protein D2V93_02890 [Allomuricauda taeanensis]
MPSTEIRLENKLGGWKSSVVSTECTLHQLSPYIGKMKSSMAKGLVENFSHYGDTVYDPFAGCGTIALESWILGRKVIANDLSPYAHILTMGKMNPLNTENKILETIEELSNEIKEEGLKTDLRQIPDWVKEFFDERTLHEIIVWKDKLTSKNQWFLLSCLMGILHHQRPGFLSYPCSHTVPYLRTKKFPPKDFPDLYKYRPLEPRLQSKALRAIRRLPKLDYGLARNCFQNNSEHLTPPVKVNSIISSPPYMRRLDYGRDNRLRLWLLGENNWKELDNVISPSESNFLDSMRICFRTWLDVLVENGKCVLVLDDSYSKKYELSLIDTIIKIACEEVGGYRHLGNFEDKIPNERRVRRNHSGSKSEIIVVLEKEKI